MSWRSAACLVVVAACGNDIPGPPTNLAITPDSWPLGEEVAVTITGTFEVATVTIEHPSARVSASASARLGDEPLGDVRATGDGQLTAVVPATLDAGSYPLVVVDARGREGRLEDAFRVLTPTEQIASLRIDPIAEAIIEVPFSVTVTALDNEGDPLVEFEDMAAVSDGTGSVSPTSIGPFVGGVWTGDLTINIPAVANQVTVTAGNATANSNPFDVLCPGSCTCLPWYPDDDNDGFGEEAGQRWACTAFPGTIDLAGDCDDGEDTVYPGAPEVPADGIDQNCDGLDACYRDGDGDDYGGADQVTDTDLDCANGSAGESEVTGDCNDADASIHPDATEVFNDGIDQDCSGGDRCYQDLDGDGYGTTIEVDDNDLDCGNRSANEADNADDCDDGLVTCTLDCTQNTDGDDPPVPDCVEQHCGTDPSDPSDTCVRTDGTTSTLEDQIAAANATPGHESILVEYSPTVTTPIVIDSADEACIHLRVAAGEQVVVSNSGIGVQIEDSGCYIERILVDGGATGVVVAGDNSTLQQIRVSGFADEGVRFTGADNQLVDSIIDGCLGPESGGRAGVVIDYVGGGQRPDRNLIADNLIVNNACAAMQLRESPDGTVIDQNTIAFNSAAVVFLSAGAGASNVCVRNNLITDNVGAALTFNKAITFDTTAACTGPLGGGPTYGNNEFGNTLGACGGTVCTGCSCLPAGEFWSVNADPAYVEISDLSSVTAFCISESTLVDAGADLGYDLNGDQDGTYTGSAPDIGARESGAGGCP